MHSKLKPYRYTSVNSAFEKILQQTRLIPKSEIVSTVCAYRRVLAENIISKSNVPAYDTSHMDGFAVSAKEISHASSTKPVFLKVRQWLLTKSSEKSDFNHLNDHASFMASWPSNILRSGEAFEISTGGYLPKGADTIIPFEQATIVGNEIKVHAPSPKGAFVYPIGTDIQAKQPIFSKGHLLRAQDIALLASLRIKKVALFRKPKVGLIPTGSELADEFDHIAPGKKFNTNSTMVARVIQEGGGLPIDFGITPDDIHTIQRKVCSALSTCDLILTSGGTSIGKHDFVQNAINSIGRPGMLAHGIKLDRGRVAGVAVLNRKPIVCLPGPIQAALNTFLVFAYPMIRLLSGRPRKKMVFYARLTKHWQARQRFSDFLKVVYVKVSYYKRTFKAEPLAGETESISLLSKANGYILVPEKVRKMIAGQTVAINLLPGFSDINGELI
ncbi:MAG TPA: molybdopterin molybdotransferase MoeA [Nitrososphaeraceae archaeon]|nr:molybdopterin molybdotransferase MoeA [Nitrososphaeraceae archaeon]